MSRIGLLRAHLIERESDHRNLLNYSKQIIEGALEKNNIQHLPILARLKGIESACQKAESKKYVSAIKEMTDIFGIRVVVLIESDIQRTSEIIKKTFFVDEKNSVDKRTELGTSQFGYSSVHIICSLGDLRASIPEYAGLCDILFEVQVRSALQHTWAEIEHKRRYKGENALPSELERRLNAASAALELIDREFSEISRLAEEYKASITSKDAGNLSDPLTRIALETLLSRALVNAGEKGELVSNDEPSVTDLINEMENFGAKQVGDVIELLDRPATEDVIHAYAIRANGLFKPGVLFYRMIMLANDAERFLRASQNSKISGITERSVSVLESIPTGKNVRNVLREYGVPIADDASLHRTEGRPARNRDQ